MILAYDMEWSPQTGIDVLGLGWGDGQYATATNRTQETMRQFLGALHTAERIAGQNALDADLQQLKREGFDVSALMAKTFDIRLAFYAVNGHLAGTGSYDLRSIVLLLDGRGGFRFPLDFKHYENDLHCTCAMDAAAVSWAVPTLDRQIRTYHLNPLVEQLHRCQPIFSAMHEQGVKLDRAVLERIYQDRKTKLATNIAKYGLSEKRGKKVIKEVPIWRSPKVLDLYEQRFGERPKNLQRKTWLQLAAYGPSQEAKEFAQAIVELSQGANDAHWLGHAEETEYGIDFSKVGADGFVHPRYDLCGSPDRAVASAPNCQNFPRVSDDPRPTPLRSAVIPLDESHSILGVDFSSIETITNAYESKDMDRVMAVLEKRVSHEGTAALINQTFGLSLTRQQGKAINHAFDKGEAPFNLARRLFGVERPSRQQSLQCQAIYDRMLREFPQTAKFREDLWERARENPLIVTNSFGRRLLCFSRSKYGDGDERFAKHNEAKKYWCSCSACAPRRDRWKYAIAFLGRSAAFDALLQKMYVIYHEKRLDEFSLPYLEVHDELDYSVPTEHIECYAARVKDVFEKPIDWLGGLQLPSDVKHGRSWAEAH